MRKAFGTKRCFFHVLGFTDGLHYLLGSVEVNDGAMQFASRWQTTKHREYPRAWILLSATTDNVMLFGGPKEFREMYRSRFG